MKLEINIDPDRQETLVKVYAQSMNNDVVLIQKMLESSTVQRIMGIHEEKVLLLEPSEILRFFTSDKKVFAKTATATYAIRLRMYELEERFRSASFIRISQGELINLDHVKRLDLSHKGTIAVEFTTGDVSYVSRRSLKNFKKALGI